MLKLACIFSVLSFGVITSFAEDVRHAQVQQRYSFGIKLLKLSLSKVGEYQVKGPKKQNLNEARLKKEILIGNVDVAFLSTTKKLEADMVAVKIPVYRGLLGLRLLLGNKTRINELSSIESLKDLQNYKGGHGAHWGDISIYKANSLKVSKQVSYEQIFNILKINRIDYFHRGLVEIWKEQQKHSNDLKIIDNVMLFYKLPVYFFVTKNKKYLAKDIEKGLRLAIQDGSYKKLFLSSFGKVIKKADLDNRKLIYLTNPDLPNSSLVIDTSWWAPEKYKSELK